MADDPTQITRREMRDGKTWSRKVGAQHVFRLRKPKLSVIEVEDVNFHHNSAVMMPDYVTDAADRAGDTDNDASGVGDQVELAGLAAIVACLRHAQQTPDARLVVVGHADTSGQDQYNLEISRLRARAVQAVLLGKRDEWIDVCMARSKVEDYQQILKWVAKTLVWPCDPGDIDDTSDEQTRKAVRGFQESYNAWQDDSKKVESIGVDGVVGRQTWGAIFDIYQDTLEVLLEVETEAELEALRQSLRWLDDNAKYVGCGEEKPVDSPELDNYKSETNRRVEILFFEPDEAPRVPLRCHPTPQRCDAKACEIYWKFERAYLPVAPQRIPRGAFRLSLRLGNLDDLFADAPDTEAGRMARLQVAGLFYFPLRHRHARNAFNGLAATAPNAATGHPGDQAFTGTWSYYKSDIVAGKSAASPATDAEADADLQQRLAQFVVDGGTLPAPVAEGATPAEANFRKIRVPGGFTFVDALEGGLDTNRDPAYPMEMTGSQFAVEDLYFRDNPILGKVPLVATVEARNRRTGNFEPLKNAAVYFQLLPADPLPAYDPARPCNAQVNRPALRGSHMGGPAVPALTNSAGATIAPAEPAIAAQAAGVGPLLRYTTEEARNPDASDPQGTNCHADRGGKRGRGNAADGSAVAGVIFETASRAGFNAAHPGRALPHKPYPVAQAVRPIGDQHAHAVRALTNDDGEAGAIFMPSRMGGDRYKLRVYVGPPTLQGDGREADAVKQDTGTFVVWRNLRLSRYFQVVPGNPHPTLLAEVNNPATYNVTSNAAYLQTAGCQLAPPLNNGNWNAVEGNPPPAFQGAIVMWARAWCEFELDRNALSGGNAHAVSAAEYTAARRQALADGIANQGAAGTSYNLPNLLYMEPGAPALTPANGLACIPMRTPEAYNAMPTTAILQQIPIASDGAGNPLFGADPIHQRSVANLHLGFLLRGFTRSLSQNGHLPGFVVIQSAMGCTWQMIGQNGDFSGIATNYRGGHLWYGRAVYLAAPSLPPANFSYGYDSNMIHEMGHCHYREHGPGRNPGRRPAGGNDVAKHDQPATSVCVMSYKNCEGDLCGMCSMGLRGWDIAQMTP